MTEGFAFGYDDGEECDETTEEDLQYLKDSFISLSTGVKVSYILLLKFLFNNRRYLRIFSTN